MILPRSLRRSAGLTLVLAASTFVAVPLAAQSADSPGPSRIISTNPFLPLAGWFSAEFEQRVKDNMSLAISGSHVELDDRYTNLDAKIRLYPNEKALSGFGVAAGLGVGWINPERDIFDICAPVGNGCTRTEEVKTFTTPSFSVEVDYQWLLGRTRSTAVALGLGAKRYLGGNDVYFDDATRVVPTFRISIGYGF